MARADVLQLVQDFTLAQADATEAGVFYDELVRELGFYEFVTGTESISVISNTPSYKVAEDTIRVLEVIDDVHGRLDRIDGRSLRSVFGASWRLRLGSPLAHTATDEDSDTVRLVPIPLQPSTLTIIRTESRVDMPVWLELGLAFEIIHRDFIRESAHQDIAFAQVARNIANALFSMVGLEIRNAGTQDS